MKKILFLFFTSFIILLFTSKFSFLYPFNDWQDANSFLTVARSILDGNILYKDIIEQKGPILYLIYIIGTLITTKYLSGIFILEVISLTFSLFFVDKIIKLFKDYKYSYLVLPIFGVILTTSNAFVHGGSAEEFSLPFLLVGLYYFIYNLKVEELNYKKIIINGFICSIVSMIKFNLIGLWFGFMAFIFFDLLFKRKFKKAILSCVCFLISMFVGIFIILIYFIYNNAISDFIYAYFTINVGSYTGSSSNIISRLFECFQIGFQNVFYSFIYALLFPIFIYSCFNIFKTKREKIAIFIIFITSFLGIYIGLRAFKYYALPISIFYIFIFVFVISYCYKFIDKFIKNKYRYILLVIYVLLIGLFSYLFANYKDYILTNKEDYEQFKIANIIKSKNIDDVSILNYRSLDYGFYNILDVIPNCKYFHRMNISYDRLADNYDVQDDCIKNRLVDFVIIGFKPLEDNVEELIYLFDNYTLIYDSYQRYEKYNIHFYLFESKNLL